ncbi:MAG: XRE family transcriptional regulator [Acidimicrobiia bacterium]|nr:XRE family transcriptional regulator [Acidimicrobiia bacterium]
MTMARHDRPNSTTFSRLNAASVIREARELAGLSQAELAARMQTAQSAVSRWERGLDVPRVDTLGRILRACGFEADVRFRRHDDVDRGQILNQLSLSPLERARALDEVVDFINEGREAMAEARGG